MGWGHFTKVAHIACVTLLAASALPAARTAGWQWETLPAGAKAPAIPVDNAMTAARVALGRRLFYDADLSLDGTMSCSTCHEQKRGFTDGNRTHAGVSGEDGVRNVQGLANVAWRSPLTWADAQLTTLEQQAMVPIAGEHPIEMGMKDGEAEIARRLGADACYPRMFAVAFPKSGAHIGFREVGMALAAFERSLVSTNSPHDRFRAGKAEALSPLAKRGAVQFATGCASCHNGPDLTDNAYHYVGTGNGTKASLYGGPQVDTAEPAPVSAADQFRTPPLRNVAVTGPWLHDGSAASIEDAIRRHAPTALVNAEMPALLAFLDAQTDASFLADPRFARPANACTIAAR